MAYVCFIVDAFSRRIVGWRVAANMKTDMVLDALEMARAHRGARRLVGLVAHADAGSQFTSVRFTERLDEIGARPSHRHRRRLLRQRAGRDDQRALQDRVRLRARRHRPGTTSTRSSSPPCPGCTGSTSTGSTATATTCRPPSSKQRSTLPNSPTPPGLESNSPSLHQTQGGSDQPRRQVAARAPSPRRLSSSFDGRVAFGSIMTADRASWVGRRPGWGRSSFDFGHAPVSSVRRSGVERQTFRCRASDVPVFERQTSGSPAPAMFVDKHCRNVGLVDACSAGHRRRPGSRRVSRANTEMRPGRKKPVDACR